MIRDAGPTLTGQAVRARGTVVPQFLARHALSAPDAIAFAPATPRERKAFAALIAAGALREAATGRFFLDLPRYLLTEEARRRRLVPIALAGAAILAGLVTLLYRG